MRLGAVLGLVAAAICALPVVGAALRTGDILVTGEVGDPFIGPVTGKIREFAPDGTLVQEFTVLGLELKFSPAGILHVAAFSRVERFAGNGSLMSPILNPAPEYPIVSLAFDQAGNLFAGTRYGNVLKFGSDGALLATFAPGTVGFGLYDLGTDGCTLYYFNPTNKIGRFDVCTGLLKSSLTTSIPEIGYKVFVLPDGTLLASTAPPTGMYRVQTDGTVIRRYTTAGTPYSLDLDRIFCG